ncbi:Tetratricopeptide repeat protein 17 [Mactra antiquata]
MPDACDPMKLDILPQMYLREVLGYLIILESNWYNDNIKQLGGQNKNGDSLTLFVNGQLTKIVPVKGKQQGQNENVYIHVGHTSGGGTSTNEGGVDKVPPFQAHVVVNPQQGEVGDGMVKEKEIRQLAAEMLPDTRKFIKRRLHLAVPKMEDCRKVPKLELRRFSSTWLSLSVKKVFVRQHIDCKEVIDKTMYEEPNCIYEIPEETIVDFLPGVQYRNDLDYYSEIGLKEVLQMMSGRLESVEIVGARIARALKRNETSWVISNMAALYWRVRGNANKAIECLRIAIHYAPKHSKDVGLLSLSNVLHKAKYINDAIMTSSFILELSPSLVVGHFNIANLYADREQWNFAAMFYESTLGLQDSFDPAKQRLRAIQCMRVTQQPSPQE